MSLRYEQFSPAGELHQVGGVLAPDRRGRSRAASQRILLDGYVEIILHLGDPFLRVDEGTRVPAGADILRRSDDSPGARDGDRAHVRLGHPAAPWPRPPWPACPRAS